VSFGIRYIHTVFDWWFERGDKRKGMSITKNELEKQNYTTN